MAGPAGRSAPKTRSQAGRGGRSVQKKGAKPNRQLSRNITRWSANKDIALLCALAKECRKDKFRISWDRVAKWIGPNVTGGAIEQHVAKLYSKLKEHRTSMEPKRKKRKNNNQADMDEVDGDYVEDEDIWNKGNEAFANIFYDKPDASSMILQNDGDDADFEDGLHHNGPERKQASVKYEENSDEDDEYEANDQALVPYGGQYAQPGYEDEERYQQVAEGRESIRGDYHSYGDPEEATRVDPRLPYGYGIPTSSNSPRGYGNNYMQQQAMHHTPQQSNDGFAGFPTQLGSPMEMFPKTALTDPVMGLYQKPNDHYRQQNAGFGGMQMLNTDGSHAPQSMMLQPSGPKMSRLVATNRLHNQQMFEGSATAANNYHSGGDSSGHKDEKHVFSPYLDGDTRTGQMMLSGASPARHQLVHSQATIPQSVPASSGGRNGFQFINHAGDFPGRTGSSTLAELGSDSAHTRFADQGRGASSREDIGGHTVPLSTFLRNESYDERGPLTYNQVLAHTFSESGNVMAAERLIRRPGLDRPDPTATMLPILESPDNNSGIDLGSARNHGATRANDQQTSLFSQFVNDDEDDSAED